MPAEVAAAMRADLEAREPPVEVWPEHWPAVELFCALATQWRVAFGGAVGLDYAALEAVMRIRRIPPAERAALFEQIRIMEAAALEALRD